MSPKLITKNNQPKQLFKIKVGDLERVENGKKVVCPLCKKVFGRAFISKHIRWVHEKTKEKCDQCGKDVCQLKRHIDEVHKNIRNHICENCGHKCLTAHELRHHKKLKHEGHREVIILEVFSFKYFSSHCCLDMSNMWQVIC